MANHPNRSKSHAFRNPKPEEIIAAREAAGLSQGAAAGLICSTVRTWQDWEAGIARMHAGLWCAFRVAVEHPKIWAKYAAETVPREG